MYVDILFIPILVMFIVYAYISSSNYETLLEVCDTKSNTIEKQKTHYEETISKLEDRCEDLTSKYFNSVEENSNLKSRLRRVKLPTYKYSEDEVYLLAQCVEAEAGYYDGHATSQRFIAQVILNRVHSGKFPNSIREVIYQKDDGIPQFSVAYDGAINREVRDDTLANVYSVLVHGTSLPEYVCYFYSASVKENWVNTLPIYDTVEGTVFAYEGKEDY